MSGITTVPDQFSADGDVPFDGASPVFYAGFGWAVVGPSILYARDFSGWTLALTQGQSAVAMTDSLMGVGGRLMTTPGYVTNLFATLASALTSFNSDVAFTAQKSTDSGSTWANLMAPSGNSLNLPIAKNASQGFAAASPELFQFLFPFNKGDRLRITVTTASGMTPSTNTAYAGLVIVPKVTQ